MQPIACKLHKFFLQEMAPTVSLPHFSCAGDWTQILGVFSSKGNIKADMFSKLLLEAVILAEQAGLFVDFVMCDVATWNRSMWKSF